MIFRLRYDRNSYLVGDISFEEINAKMGDYFALDAALWNEFWNPVNIKFIDDSDRRNVLTPPDITCWFTNELILNQRAYDSIGDKLAPYGELLPAFCEGVPYWILHVLERTGIDTVDQSESERVIEDGGFIDLKALRFKENKVKDKLLFKTEFSNYRNIYCTEKFKNLVENAKLRGLIFSTDLAGITEP